METPTYDCWQVARIVGRSVKWVRLLAARHRIGSRPTGWARRFTARDLALMRALVRPGEKRGRPRKEKG